MKNISFLIIWLSLLLYCTTGLCIGTVDDQTGAPSTTSSGNTIQLVSSLELNSLTTNWAHEYGKLNPGIKINLNIMGEGQGKDQISFISNDQSGAFNDGKSWKMVIGRDAIVAVVNAKNPMLKAINDQGISEEELAQLFSNPEKRNWESLLNDGQNAPIHYYIIDNEKVKAGIGNFTNTDQAAINGITVATAPEMISAVQKDLYAIGFCKLTDVRNATTNEMLQGIQLLPIDKNRNGRIDNFENIYGSMDAFTRGVWIGKYPNALCGNIYAASSTQPTDDNTVAFLTWIITDGQKYLNKNGYSVLASREVKSNIAALTVSNTTLAANKRKSFISSTWLINLIILSIVGLIVFVLVRYIKKQNLNVPDMEIDLTPVWNENNISTPKGLYFDKTHTWAFMEKDGNVKVGIDDFLQHITGTLTRIIMKGTGEKVRKGEKIITLIRDGKQLNIYAPISGTILEQNKTLILEASLLNSSPFSEGWVYLIEPKNWVRENQFLFMAERYKEWLNDEFSRLKDFFAASVRSNTAVYTHIILQDGGELTDNILAEMGPEVWEDFQTKFIDTSK